MKIIAIDPGFDRVGVALIEEEKNNQYSVLFSECITTNKHDAFIDRIFFVADRIEFLIQKHKPSVMAIENLFFTTNKKTAMRVAEARGVIMYKAKLLDLSIHEYTPMEIKVAVTGYGKATKDDVFFMVKKILKTEIEEKTTDDEIDAIAVGITFFARHKTDSLLSPIQQ
jgi:crossover junction endodeoxyribonuclease RuvC